MDQQVFSYSIDQADEDGFNQRWDRVFAEDANILGMPKEQGINGPIYLSIGILMDLRAIPESRSHESVAGRAWDMLTLFANKLRAMKKANDNDRMITFDFILSQEVDQPYTRTSRKTGKTTNHTRKVAIAKTYKVWAFIEPQQDGSPCFSLMRPDEY